MNYCTNGNEELIVIINIFRLVKFFLKTFKTYGSEVKEANAN